MKQSSVTSQISDFNQSIQRNHLNYENIMKSTRQKIIQSHMMQSAQKQKPYLMRLSSIFGDDKTPPGILKGNKSSIEFGMAIRKKQTMKSMNRRPPLAGLVQSDESQAETAPKLSL